MSPQNAVKKVERWVSTIYITYEPYKGSWENRLKNPVGFKVMRYGTETKQQFDARERELLRDKNG
jgi:type IV secretory pathway component VirB8